jgi:exodeoxyribonuclease V gamma subunit
MPDTDDTIQVFYSNRTENLVEALALTLEETGGFDSVFSTPSILVPNWNLARYLKYELSQRFGVSGDYFLTLEGFLQETTDDDVHFLDDAQLRASILRLLTDDQFLASEELTPVRRYLADVREDDRANSGGELEAGDGTSLKRYQLAKRLTKNFRQYGHSRGEMIQYWHQNTDLFLDEENYRSNERWQKQLWKRLFNHRGQLIVGNDDAPARYLLTEYFRTVDPGELATPESVDVFAVSHFAPVYGQIFETLSEQSQLRFYALNPCREFWEDVIYDEEEEILDGKNRLNERREQAEGALSDEHSWDLDPDSTDDPPLALTAWGRAGRDLNNMLNTLSGYSFGGFWYDPVEFTENPTLLKQFQSDVLNYRSSLESPQHHEPDHSVQFLSCPSKRREVEIVADEIWSIVTEQESSEDWSGDVGFHDVAVIVNPRDREEYQAQIETVFEQVHDIPFNQIDLTRGQGSRLMDGLENLLRLPAEPIQRENVLRIMTHPNFTSSRPEADSEQWKQWVDELAIFHGADHKDHEGTYIERDLFNWDQGLKRLVLGTFMEETDEDGDDRWFNHGDETYRPRSISGSKTETAGTFIESARELIAAARSVRRSERSLSDWFRWMGDFIREHLSPASDTTEPEYYSYLETLNELAEIDTGPESVDYETALEFALDELESEDYERGSYLASGVVVSSFTPQRPIPFDVIFMLGMDEDNFPDSSPRSPLDLQSERWQEGDLKDRDREQYMFLDTLLCARERVYLSWVSQDPVTGDRIEPSSVIRELQSILGGYLPEERLDELVHEYPLRRHDERYFRDGSEAKSKDAGNVSPLFLTFNPEAIAEARVKTLRETVVSALPEENPEISLKTLSDEARELLRSVDTPDLEQIEDPDYSKPVELRAKALESFLVSPLQGWAKFKLGLIEEDTDTVVDQNEEPFETNRLWGSVIKRGAMRNALLREDSLPSWSTVDEEYAVEKHRLQAQGKVPYGVFGELQRRKDRDLLKDWLDRFEEDSPDGVTRYRFGASGHSDESELVYPLEFTIDRPGANQQTVDLTGDSQLVDPQRNTVYYFGESTSPKYFLRCYLTGVMLVAADILDGEDVRTVLCLREGLEERIFSIGDRNNARRYLKSLITDLLTQPHDYRMPMDVSESFLEDGGAAGDQTYEERVREKDDSAWTSTRDKYGPIENYQEYRTPGYGTEDPDRAVEDLLKRRQQIFWEGYFGCDWNRFGEGNDS